LKKTVELELSGCWLSGRWLSGRWLSGRWLTGSAWPLG